MKKIFLLFLIVLISSSCAKRATKKRKPVLTVAGVVHVCPSGKIALIERGKKPFGFAMFGGHVEDESPQDAFMRELKEELNVSTIFNLQLIGVHGNPGRDVRQHSVEITYSAITNQNPIAGDDAKSVKLYTEDEILEMSKSGKFAFDHGEIIERYIKKLNKCNVCNTDCIVGLK